jgi:hypothetical protein
VLSGSAVRSMLGRAAFILGGLGGGAVVVVSSPGLVCCFSLQTIGFVLEQNDQLKWVDEAKRSRKRLPCMLYINSNSN